jgi:prophage antirepressor-like protein
MYTLVFKSQKTGAHAFKHWITHEALAPPIFRNLHGYLENYRKRFVPRPFTH